MNKLRIYIIAGSVVLVVLFILSLTLSKKGSVLPGALSPTPSIVIPTSVENIHPTGEFESYTKNPAKPTEFDDHTLPTDAPIQTFDLKSIGSVIPTGMTKIELQKNEKGEKLSPGEIYSAAIEGPNLNIYDDTHTKIQTVALNQDIQKANFTWVNNKTLLLIEKESSPRGVDFISVVNRSTGKKTFLIATFPIPKRLDLSSVPLVYNNGTIIFLKDNDGQYWQLSLII
jgi:hypothetical protein